MSAARINGTILWRQEGGLTDPVGHFQTLQYCNYTDKRVILTYDFMLHIAEEQF